ncbi:MAG: ATP-binding protein [Methanomassiliicoccaceae archaeon]|jgi:replicative DNA helicase Mcm|nr:ATP-binding protein [Methanomassiliicoccaceae archaeon]
MAGGNMNFKAEEIITGWEDILSKKYQLKLNEIADSYPDKRSIYVSYADIDEYNSDMAMFMLDHPDMCLQQGVKALKTLLPSSEERKRNVNLRITGLPRDARVDIRELRAKHLGRFVAIEGLVRKATTVKPRMTGAVFKCARCGAEMWVDQTGSLLREPSACSGKEGSCSKTNAQFILLGEKSRYMDTQKIEVQESPEGLRGGAQPERISGFLEDDIAGTTFPGNRVVLNGIIRTVQKGEREKSAVFDIFIEVHSMEFEQYEYDEIVITEDDEKKILEMAEDPDLFENMVRSISPTIYGLDNEKEAIALQLFGGTHKIMDDRTVIRGDIHILLIGDPGTAKSQLLRQMSTVAPRGIYASGKSASAAGLCVHGDTVINTGNGNVTIKEFAEFRMNSPEEYKKGIWRQAVSGDMVVSVTEKGYPRALPVSFVWKIATPSFLVELITEKNDTLILTPETKILAGSGGKFDWTESSKIVPGDLAMVADKEKTLMRAVAVKRVNVIREGLPEFVYDLTVEQAHSFLGNGFAVHNTAAAVKDDFGDGRWTLEAGALVLADMGLACIDELDKMSEQDRSSLHEAMESQRISVAKAGITAALQCRCSMLAAANPKKGRFDDTDIGSQIDLPPALMSRFDMMFILRDKPEPESDTRITEHILKVHRRGQVKKRADAGKDVTADISDESEEIRPVYDVEMLRKYVAYAKKKIIPVMSKEAFDRIRGNYLLIRKTGGGKSNTVPITARQLEAYIRLAEASAKARLSETVTLDDAERSIKLIHYFLDRVLGGEGENKTRWDIDAIATGTSAKTKDAMQTIKEVIRDHEVGSSEGITKKELMNKVIGFIKEEEMDAVLERLMRQGDIYNPSFGVYRLM